LEEFQRAFPSGQHVPAWAREEVDAVLAIVPRDGNDCDAWLRQADVEALNEVCEALLSLYAVTEREHGRQTKG
jgi:hypothetical protein